MVWDRWDNMAGGVHVKKGPVIWGTREHPNRSKGPSELSQEELVSYRVIGGVKGTNRVML